MTTINTTPENPEQINAIARTYQILAAIKAEFPDEPLDKIGFSRRLQVVVDQSPWFYPQVSTLSKKMQCCIDEFNKQGGRKAITYGSLSQWLADLTHPAGDVLEFLAEKLEINPTWLVKRSDVVCISYAEDDISLLLNNEDYRKTVGGRLSALIVNAGISRKNFSTIALTSRSTAYKWLTNQGMPQADSLMAISAYFKVSTDWILFGVELYHQETLCDLDTPTEKNKSIGADQALLHPAQVCELVKNGVDLKSVFPAFKLKHFGDAMSNPQHIQHIPSGAILTVSTQVETAALNGSVIVVAINTASDSLALEVGAYSSFGGHKLLSSLSGKYPSHEIGPSDLILGVVTDYSFNLANAEYIDLMRRAAEDNPELPLKFIQDAIQAKKEIEAGQFTRYQKKSTQSEN